MKRDFDNAVSTINEVTIQLRKKYYHDDQEQKILLFLDEIQPCKNNYDINFNMSDLDTSIPCIDLLLAINPQDIQNRGKFQIIPPKCKNTISQQLFNRHRNNYENGVFLEHYKSIIETFRGILNPSMDRSLDPSILPLGRLTVWMQVQKGAQISYQDILEFIKKDYVFDKEHVTVLNNKDDNQKDAQNCEGITQWCLQNGFRYINDRFPWGIEDNIVVSFNNSPGPEGLSRARNSLIMVTQQG